MHHRPAARREIEIVVASVVILYGVRALLVLNPTESGLTWLRVLSAALFLSCGLALLLWPKRLHVRTKALLGIVASGIYWTAAVVGNDPTRFASAGASFGLSVIALILYAGARAEGRKHD